MTSNRSSESRQVELSQTTRGLKILARKLECPVVALSQSPGTSSRAPTSGPSSRTCRESGSIEQDADVVMFLYRDEVSTPIPPTAAPPRSPWPAPQPHRHRPPRLAGQLHPLRRDGPPDPANIVAVLRHSL